MRWWLVASLCAVALGGSACASSAPREAPEDEAARLFPAPTSSLFTAQPVDLPTDPPGLWAVLAEVGPQLQPGAPGDDDAERQRLQACDVLGQVAEAVFESPDATYNLDGFSRATLFGLGESCADQPEASYERLRVLLRDNPYG